MKDGAAWPDPNESTEDEEDWEDIDDAEFEKFLENASSLEMADFISESLAQGLPPKALLVTLAQADIFPESMGSMFRRVDTSTLPHVLGQQLPGPFLEQFWLKWSKVSDLKAAVICGLLANVLTHSPSVALASMVVATVWNNLKVLSEPELEVIRGLQRLTKDDIYEQWVPTADLLKVIPPADGDPQEGDLGNINLLASMASRGILEEQSDLWRAVR